MVNIGTSYFREVREKAIANYKKLTGDNIDQNIISLLEAEGTSLQTLISLDKMYTQQLEEKFPLHCSKCGSKEISRASSVSTDENTEDKGSSSINDTLGNIAKSKLK